MAAEWHMPPTKGECAAGDRVFEPGEAFRAFLFAGPDGYERRDYCLTCTPPDEPAAVASWKARRPPADAPKAPPMDLEALYAMFEGLSERQEPAQVQLRFVLALLLWRRRVLKLVGTEDAADPQMAEETWRFAAPGREATHLVARPALDEEEIERLSRQLERVIAGDAAPLSDAPHGESQIA